MIYLASPYAHKNPAVMQQRYNQACIQAHSYLIRGVPVYSPIIHNHPIALMGGLPRTWDFWKSIDIPMLRLCDKLIVLTLPGWKDSVGVRAEIAFAKSAHIPISYVKPIVCPS